MNNFRRFITPYFWKFISQYFVYYTLLSVIIKNKFVVSFRLSRIRNVIKRIEIRLRFNMIERAK